MKCRITYAKQILLLIKAAFAAMFNYLLSIILERCCYHFAERRERYIIPRKM